MTTSSPAEEVAHLAEAIARTLRERPAFFMDLVRAYRQLPYRTLLLAWGEVRERHRLGRDEEGRYFILPEAAGTV